MAVVSENPKLTGMSRRSLRRPEWAAAEEIYGRQGQAARRDACFIAAGPARLMLNAHLESQGCAKVQKPLSAM